MRERARETVWCACVCETLCVCVCMRVVYVTACERVPGGVKQCVWKTLLPNCTRVTGPGAWSHLLAAANHQEIGVVQREITH